MEPIKEPKPLVLVSSSPHMHCGLTISKSMREVILALVPAVLASVYYFRVDAVRVIVCCVLSAIIFEKLANKVMGVKKDTVKDGSAALTGLLLALCLPASLPSYMAVLGGMFAVVIGKAIFGGLGKNFLNPALAGRAFLMLSYPVAMTTWAVPGEWAGLVSASDAVTGATPLSVDFMHSGVLPTASLQDMLVGNIGGCMGEVSAILLLVGGIYLIARGVIRIQVPVAFIGTVAVLTFLFPQGGNDRLTWMLYELLGGGLFLGAFFMATDYVTSPTTQKGKLVFGIGLGLITMMIRHFGTMNEGVSFAILLMNLLVPYIEVLTRQDLLGISKPKKNKGGAAK